MRAAQPTLASGLTRMMWQTSSMSCPNGRSVWHALLFKSFEHVCSSQRCSSTLPLCQILTHGNSQQSWFLYGVHYSFCQD